MIRRKSTSIALAISLILLAFIFSSVNGVFSATQPFSDKEFIYDLTAGYADELYFRVIQGDEQNVLALQAGEVDLIGQFVIPELVPPLIADPEIEINQTNRLGFGHFSFNTARGPTSRRELRQAFAYALDKDGIQVRALDSMSRPVDSPITPSKGKWSLDNDPWSKVNNYYDPDPVKGNEILDAAGWVDVDGDGWREDPDGNLVDFPIYSSSTSSIGEICITMGNEAFDSLHIKTAVQLMDFNAMMARVDNDDFYMGFWAYGTPGTDPLFLENFQSGNSGNCWNWVNATYDTLVDEMFGTSDEAIALERCLEAQKILWTEQPLVVAYQNLLISAYRKDPWTGFVNTEGQGAFTYDSFVKVRLKPEFGGSGEDYTNWQQGGRFTVSLPQQMDSTNLLNSQSAFTHRVLGLVYDTLYRQNPYSMEDCMGIAKNWTIEEFTGVLPPGYPNIEVGAPDPLLKITFDLHENFTFHDGHPLTAEDVNFTYDMMKNEGSPAYLNNVDPVTHVEIISPYKVAVYMKEGGLFTFHKINIPIFPKHIWENVENPLTWSNPIPIGSGPYKWKYRSPGELVVLERNDDYFYNPRNYIWLGTDLPDVNVLFPNGGETVSGTITVQWTGDDPDGDTLAYDVYYSPDAGVSWSLLVENTLLQQYSWDTTTVSNGGNYLIKVVASDGKVPSSDRSDFVFAVSNVPPNQPPSVSVTYPNGGETVSGTITVQWTGDDPDGDVVSYDVYYSPDAGVTWIVLVENTFATSFLWDTIKVPNGDIYLIKIVAADGINLSSDTSNAVFTVLNAKETSTSGGTSPSSFSFDTPGFGLVAALAALIIPVVVACLRRKRA